MKIFLILFGLLFVGEVLPRALLWYQYQQWENDIFGGRLSGEDPAAGTRSPSWPWRIEPLIRPAINSSNSTPLLQQQKVVQKPFPPLKIHYCPCHCPFLTAAFSLAGFHGAVSHPDYKPLSETDVATCQPAATRGCRTESYHCLNRYEIGSRPRPG